MKKISLAIVFCTLSSSFAFAQNLQLHYDFRHSLYDTVAAPRNYLMATFEMFKPDRLGSTFMFVDFDFTGGNTNLGTIYTEIARDFQIGRFPIMPHIEYNGGISSGFTIENAFMAGSSYNFTLGRFNMNTYLAYKLHTFERLSHDAQLTLVWSANLLNERLTISGFADIWTENRNRTSGQQGKKVIFMSEPQIWFNIVPSFAVGSEVRMSYNFITANKFYIIPTIAVKYTF